MNKFNIGDKVTMYAYWYIAFNENKEIPYKGEVGTIISFTGEYFDVEFETPIDGINPYLLFDEEMELVSSVIFLEEEIKECGKMKLVSE